MGLNDFKVIHVTVLCISLLIIALPEAAYITLGYTESFYVNNCKAANAAVLH